MKLTIDGPIFFDSVKLRLSTHIDPVFWLILKENEKKIDLKQHMIDKTKLELVTKNKE